LAVALKKLHSSLESL